MQLLVEVPSNLPDAAQCTPQQFITDAKLAMTIKLFKMKRLANGTVQWTDNIDISPDTLYLAGRPCSQISL